GPAGTGPAGTGPAGTGPAGTGLAGTGLAGTAAARPRPSARQTPWTGSAWAGTAATGTPRTGTGSGATGAGGTGPGTAGTGTTGTGTTGTGSSGTRGTGSGGTGSGGTGAGATRAAARPYGADRAAIRPAPGRAQGAHARTAAAAAAPRAAEAEAAKLPWYEVAHARRAAEGYQNCGPLERVLRREWPPSKIPSPPVVRAINRLAELPLMIKEILAAGVDAIHVGEGGVPELDDMVRLRGVPLPSGRATWDACAGAYGEKKIIVGSRPSSAPDVMCHEVGHALDDIDREQGRWQSDSAQFRQLYERCEESLVSDFHKQPGDLGRREFFADAFAAIASRQRPALVDMLGGNIRTALDVMLYFNLRYGL
ncbi:MAG TPA: hypothetical protein VIK57_23815, partial [Streptosporangiaceae bacterium]